MVNGKVVDSPDLFDSPQEQNEEASSDPPDLQASLPSLWPSLPPDTFTEVEVVARIVGLAAYQADSLTYSR